MPASLAPLSAGGTSAHSTRRKRLRRRKRDLSQRRTARQLAQKSCLPDPTLTGDQDVVLGATVERPANGVEVGVDKQRWASPSVRAR